MPDTPQSRSVTFDEIASLNHERMIALGIHPRVRTMEFSLMQLMSSVGELATLAYRSTNISSFEQEEVAVILGNLAVSLATLGESFKVNIGEAALQRINSQLHRSTSRSEPVVTQNNGAGKGNSVPRLAPTEPERVLPPEPTFAVLSPTSREEFFQNLDAAAKCNKSEFESLGLTWIVPGHDGKIVELIPDGSRKPVRHEELREYFDRIYPFRRGAQQQQQPQPVVPQVARTPMVHNHAARASSNNDTVGLFSPHHFDAGIFSPFVEPHNAPQLASESPRFGIPSPQKEYDDFLENFRKIENGTVSGARIGLLRMKFAVPLPEGGQLDLVPGGSHVPVTDANVEEFMRHVRYQIQQRQRNSRSVSEPIRRTDSIKRVEVCDRTYDPAADGSKFSPTHFTHDIFSPFGNRTDFVVDYDRPEDCLPNILRHASQPQEMTTPSYTQYLINKGAEGFRIIVEAVERNKSDATRFGVTYCMPSSLHGGVRGGDPLFDLVDNGRNVPVEEAHAHIFLALARPYL